MENIYIGQLVSYFTNDGFRYYIITGFDNYYFRTRDIVMNTGVAFNRECYRIINNQIIV